MLKKSLKLLFALLLIKSLMWMVLTPIFQVPDEPSHFSIVQFIVQNGQRPHPRRQRVTSQQILKAAGIVNFNWQIQHPVWQGYQDNWKQKINSLDKNLNSIFEKNPYQTSLKRPPLYYYLASLFYFPFKNAGFLTGFFALRFFSIIITLFTVYISFLTVQTIFSQPTLSLAVTSLIAFHPLLSFIGIGIHYDPLSILITTIYLYLVTLFLKTSRRIYFKLGLVTALLGLLVRPDLIALLLSLLFIFPKKSRRWVIITVILIGVVLLSLTPSALTTAIIQEKWWAGRLIYQFSLNEYAIALQLILKTFFSSSILTKLFLYYQTAKNSHLIQIFPWYWGVFGWLEATLPLFIYRILKLLILSSLIGWLKLLITKKSTIALSKTKIKSLVFLVGFAFIHAALVILNDFQSFAYSGNFFGIQGRYFLPAIISHMTIMTVGLSQLVSKKHQPTLWRLIISASVLLNLVGLITLYQYFGWVW